ncbi:MAG: DUF3509 domain-containing protein [Pseudomonas sp.]
MSFVLHANIAFAAAFADFDVTTQIRPDGSLLLTLNSDERVIIRRAIDVGQFNTPLQLEWQVGAIRRDLALGAGRSPVIATLQSQSRTSLPTYDFCRSTGPRRGCRV